MKKHEKIIFLFAFLVVLLALAFPQKSQAGWGFASSIENIGNDDTSNIGNCVELEQTPTELRDTAIETGTWMCGRVTEVGKYAVQYAGYFSCIKDAGDETVFMMMAQLPSQEACEAFRGKVVENIK